MRGYLLEQMRLPAAMIDQAHEDGLIYSDRRKNCVFLHDRNSAAFIINTQGKPFARNLGQDGNPFVLQGSDKTVYITGTPLEALSLKAIHPDSTILATGRFLHKDKLKPYLQAGVDIFWPRAGKNLAKNTPGIWLNTSPKLNA